MRGNKESEAKRGAGTVRENKETEAERGTGTVRGNKEIEEERVRGTVWKSGGEKEGVRKRK